MPIWESEHLTNRFSLERQQRRAVRRRRRRHFRCPQ